ncbi:MAG: hypothetical protein GXP14_01585 [Gammaproteobacteria bacterium]|nr:hypothetical protein [Gammaproteobacteria bacterium]
MKIKEKIIYLFVGLVFLPLEVFAADSYRWLRVSPETPWAIFVFLLPMVLIPIVLMAILHWRYAGKSKQAQADKKPVEARNRTTPLWGKR